MCADYWGGDLEALTTLASPLIADAKALTVSSDDATRPSAYELLAKTYDITARFAIMFGDSELAFSALRSALRAAERGNDPLLGPAMVITLATTYVRRGEYAQAHQVATATAEQITPNFGHGTPPEGFAVWGNLLILAAVAASRDNRAEEARECMSMAHAAAQRLGRDCMAYEMHFGPTIAMMEGAGVAIRIGDIGRALDLTDNIRSTDALRPVAKSNYLLNTAHANMLAHRYTRASDILAEVHDASPEWFRHQVLAHQILTTLLEQEQRSSQVWHLARVAGVVR
jgi:hypothetical protein